MPEISLNCGERANKHVLKNKQIKLVDVGVSWHFSVSLSLSPIRTNANEQMLLLVYYEVTIENRETGILFNQFWYQSAFVNVVCDREWILGGARTRSAALTSTWSWHGAGQRWAQPGNGRWQGCLQGGHEPEWHRCFSRDEWWHDEGFLQREENNEKQITKSSYGIIQQNTSQ